MLIHFAQVFVVIAVFLWFRTNPDYFLDLLSVLGFVLNIFIPKYNITLPIVCLPKGISPFWEHPVSCFSAADVSIVQLLCMCVFTLIAPLREDDFIVTASPLASPPGVTLRRIMVWGHGFVLGCQDGRLPGKDTTAQGRFPLLRGTD